MPSDLREALVDAHNAIPVLPLPLEAIRSGAGAGAVAVAPPSRRRLLAATAITAAALALVAAAGVLGTQIGFSPSGGIAVSTSSLGFTPHPSEADVLALARRVDFPAQLPSGLPAGTTIAQAGQLDRSAIFVTYNLPGAWRRSDHLLWVFLANPRAVGPMPKKQRGRYLLTIGGRATRGTVRWRVGGEDVVVAADMITPAELRHLKDAMLAEAAKRR